MMKVATISCLMVLLLTGYAWAGDCGHGCGDCAVKCNPCADQPPCGCAQQTCCEPSDNCCDFGMDAIMSGLHEIPVLDEGLWELPTDCCLDEYRLIPCHEWCLDFTICCPREDYRLICQPECRPQCPTHRKCKQDICTPVSGCDDVDISEGIEVG